MVWMVLKVRETVWMRIKENNGDHFLKRKCNKLSGMDKNGNFSKLTGME